MSKFEEAVDRYSSENNRLNLGLSDDFIKSVAKGLGPSIYNADAECVSASDKSEVERIKKNFLIKKLGLEDGAHLDDAIDEVTQKLGASNRKKYRALFYALLAKKFNKESVY